MSIPGNILNRFFLSGTLAALCVAAGFAAPDMSPKADAVSPEDAHFFEAKVRPLLANRCAACHNATTQSGGVRLDSLASMRQGNSGGPVVIPGEPDKSPLMHVIRYDGKVKMPPSGKMSADEIATLTEWVRRGAPWPGAKPTVPAARSGEVTDTQRQFWSFRPVRQPPVPSVKDRAWVQSPIDAFVLAKLEAKGLQPAPTADRRTLLRRVTFDLTGLPPTPAEYAAFLTDKSPDAYAKVVDRLLASPAYGERWGRHWLDVARYADTKGYVFTEDGVYHNAYTYRDYVIRAFNEDLPYDQFVIQQLAADCLPLGDDHRPLAALGFLTLGRRFLNDPVLIADDRIDVTCRGLMALTVGCARCHDHKFDPIPTKDYYSLYGVLASVNEPNPPLAISPKEIRDPYAAQQAKLGAAEKERDDTIRAQVERLRKIVEKTPEQLSKEVKDTLQGLRPEELPSDKQLEKLSAQFENGITDKLKTLRATLDTLRKTMPPTPEFAMAVQESPQPVEPHVFRRGNPDNPGDAVPRQFLAVLSGPDRKPFAHGSGRLELAKDIASPQNPLTARVLVNRVWLYHFGEGIVRTPSDFGTRGEPPTHPELLDWLASRFIEQGWSLKKLHRLILLSNTYRQSSAFRTAGFAKDPENRLLWRQNRQRLDLEALRDSLLFVSGKLDRKIGGPAVELTTAPFSTRRTVYGFIERQNLQGLFRTFDFASPDTSSARRYNTTIPQQALFMMNSPFVIEQARALAHRPDVTQPKETTERIRALYRVLFGRAPDADELALGQAFARRPGAGQTASSPWRYGYGAFDEQTQRVINFTPLSHFTGTAWQGGAQFPDANLHYLMLTANGGHVGIDARHAVIRRWVAPCDAVVALSGTLQHESDQGDGVRGRLVSSRTGLLGEWKVFHSRTETKRNRIVVKRGDTLDFVVDCLENHNFDSFAWSPKITGIAPEGAVTAALATSPLAHHAGERSGVREQTWSAQADFDGSQGQPTEPFGAWEQYVQTLLMTNEFTFVD